MDYAGAWMHSMIVTGETIIALRHAGHGWKEIVADLHLGSVDDAMRAAALYLSHDLPSRMTAVDRRGDAHEAPATEGSAEAQDAAAAAG